MKRIITTLTLLLGFAFAKAQWVTTVAGVLDTPGSNDGPALSARFFQPHGIAADTLGRIFIADRNNHTIRLFDTNTGLVSTLAGLAGQLGSTDGVGSAARFNEPWGLCATPDGVLYVADTKNNKIRKVTLDGTVTTVAGTGNYGTSNGSAFASTFGNPTGIEIAADGNIYVADHLTHIIRKISPNGNVSTLAGTAYVPGDADGNGTSAQFWRPYGLTLDNDGNIIVADEWNHKIRKVTPDGTVTTVAGNGMEGLVDGPAANASFNLPWDMTVGPDGKIYVADGHNYVMRTIDTDGTVSTLAGTPETIGSQDGPASAAAFSGATTIAWSKKTGSLFIGDVFNQLIREIIVDGAPSSVLTLINLNGSNQLCEGEALQITATPNGLNNYRFYVDGTMAQNNAISDYSTSLLTPGPHIIMAEADFLGSVLTSDTIEVMVMEAPTVNISAIGPTSFYEGDSVILFASGTGDFLWSTAETTQSITVTESGSYFVENTVNGCIGISEPIDVEVIPLPNALSILVQGSSLLCPGGIVNLTSTAQAGNQWLKDGWPIAGQSSKNLEVTEPGIYQVQATDPNTGITALSNEVEILEAPVPSFDFEATPSNATTGQVVSFSCTGTEMPTAFEWNFGDHVLGALNTSQLPTPTHLYTMEGVYSVQLIATDANACRHTLLKPEFIKISNAPTELFIPNAFTPNGDGENDIFRVRGRVDGPFLMAIYNQWGELLFQSENPTEGWDGLRNGLPVHSGTYAYLVKTTIGQREKSISGMVTLLR